MGRRKITFEQFKKNMTEKYGDSFFDEFEKLKKNPYNTLSDIAKKYEISRERISQIYKRINNGKFSETLLPINNKRIREEVTNLSCKNHPINFQIKFLESNNIRQILNAEAKILFHEKCQILDLKPRYNNHNNLVRINNKVVKVHTGNVGKHKYFCFRINTMDKNIHVEACYCRSLNLWFLIPKEELKKGDFIYIKENGKYDKYRENWKIIIDL